MCIFVGLFVACFGLGNGRQSVLVAGLAIMVLAAATRVATSFRRTPREWVRGTGRVLEVSDAPTDARLGRCSLQLAVEVPGMPEETVIVHDSRVPVSQWPQPGQQLPIQVAADDVRNVRVLWRDFVPVEMPSEAAWGDDEPHPAPATPPGSHLDPSPVIDFDLDHPPTGPLAPMAPPERPTADGVGPADTSPADEGRVEGSAPLADERRTDSVAPPVGEGQPGTTPSSEQARASEAQEPDRVADPAEPGRVPRPRPSPRPRPRREPTPAQVGTAPAVATAASALAPGDSAPAAGDPALATGDPARDGAGSSGGTDPDDRPPSPGPATAGGAPTDPPTPPTGPAGAISGVGITMLVSELARSVAFYRDQLGFSEVDSGAGTTVLASGVTRLVLRQESNLGAVKQRLVHLNLEVSDIEAVYADLRANGVRFTSPPRAVNQTARAQLWAAAFRDPDGHGVALTQWRPAVTSAP